MSELTPVCLSGKLLGEFYWTKGVCHGGIL
jgi:hypothetical protein